MEDIQQRFLRNVRVSSTGCWEWQGANDSRGYGKFWLHGSSRRAHRVAFLLWKGRSPRRHMVILHSCDNRCCVNPDHLNEGLQKTNVADMVAKGWAAWQTAKAA